MFLRSRRDFLKDSLRSVTALGAASVLAKFGEMNAHAESSSGYQALVCIYLAGGNDGHNTVIPISTAQQNYSLYQATRQGLALSQGSLYPILNGSDAYGLHPALAEIQGLYNQGKAAVLANVGNLVTPIDRTAYLTRNLKLVPNDLFSHPDQSAQWQSAIPNGIASSGWGGRIADSMQQGQNSSAVFPPIASAGTCGLFCTGQQTYPATVPPPSAGAKTATGMVTLGGVQNAPSTATGMQQLLTFDNGMQLVQAGNGILSRGSSYANTLTNLLQSSNIKTAFPANNPLAAQLQTIANVMSVRTELGLERQIFFCQLGNFDTHGQQKETQQALLQQLSQAAGAFYAATQELGIAQSVTTFTASEFGRTLSPSGTDGSDHAWGSHHFVIGGGVQGGQFYGSFPSLVLGSDNDANQRGTLIPTTSIAQYGATLAQWFGVPSTNMANIFPNIGNFGTANLGFLG